jgi:hypothetical protein
MAHSDDKKAMSGVQDLGQLLATLRPELMEGEFVFCTVRDASFVDYAELSPLASFCEPEGLSLVLSRVNADRGGLGYESVFCCITLAVHSSLDAVGLTAAVSGRLAERGISANVIAAYYHDHIFVPAQRANEALAILCGLATDEPGT